MMQANDYQPYHEHQTQPIAPPDADTLFGTVSEQTKEGTPVKQYPGFIAPTMTEIAIQQGNPPTNIISQQHIRAAFAARQKARQLLVFEFAIFALLMLPLTIVWSALSIATGNTYLAFPLWIALLWGWRIYRRSRVLRQPISVADDVQYQEDTDIYERQEEVGLGLLEDAVERRRDIRNAGITFRRNR